MQEAERHTNKRGIKILLSMYERYLVYFGWVVFGLVGLLQMFEAKAGFVPNYGADIIAPVMLYYSTRSRKTILSKHLKKGLMKYKPSYLYGHSALYGRPCRNLICQEHLW